MGAWTRTLGGLLLRAWRDPDGSDEPWTWEVLRVTDVADYEIGLGEPSLKRRGTDLTIVTLGPSLYTAVEAAE